MGKVKFKDLRIEDAKKFLEETYRNENIDYYRMLHMKAVAEMVRQKEIPFEAKRNLISAALLHDCMKNKKNHAKKMAEFLLEDNGNSIMVHIDDSARKEISDLIKYHNDKKSIENIFGGKKEKNALLLRKCDKKSKKVKKLKELKKKKTKYITSDEIDELIERLKNEKHI